MVEALKKFNEACEKSLVTHMEGQKKIAGLMGTALELSDGLKDFEKRGFGTHPARPVNL